MQRNPKMFKYAGALVCLLCWTYLFAAIEPKYYRREQDAAPEYLTIKVLRVNKDFNFLARSRQIEVTAEVTGVYRSASGLQPGDKIRIRYTHFRPGQGWVGPRPIPILEKKRTYPAFLTKDTQHNGYLPAARGASFEPLIRIPGNKRLQ